jgi:hypothetical protein
MARALAATALACGLALLQPGCDAGQAAPKKSAASPSSSQAAATAAANGSNATPGAMQQGAGGSASGMRANAAAPMATTAPSTDAAPIPVTEDDAATAAPGPTTLTFVDVTAQAGLSYRQAPVHAASAADSDWYSDNGLTTDAAFETGGAAAGDFDGDGFTDLYVTRLDQPGILFRNRGDGSFEDVTSAAGLALPGHHTVGAAFADLDNDGDLDLYVTTLGGTGNLLFINQGGSFSEEGAARGADLGDAQPRQGFSVSAGDYDRDGWVDLHTTDWQLGLSPKAEPSHARLLHNRGSQGAGLAGHFEDVTTAAGVVLESAKSGPLSLSSSFADLDDDGWPELLVASDFGTSRLFWNHRDGTFQDGTSAAAVGTDQNGMGMSVGDYDGDGLLDWFVSAIYCDKQTVDTVYCGGNRLYRNHGDRTFSDESDAMGVRKGGWGWGASLFDFDDDGDLDLALTNGIRFRGTSFQNYYSDPAHLWRNDGSHMLEATRLMGLIDNGDGKGLLVLDFDNDGDLDLFVVSHVLGGKLYRNDGGNENGYLRLQLTGVSANRQALGARVSVIAHAGDAPQVRELRGGNNFLGQDEPVLHFGVGAGQDPIAEVRVIWPNPDTRKLQVLQNVGRNQVLKLTEPP